MPFVTGTATSYLDLLSRLVTFLTTDATLVLSSENWTLLKDTSSEIALPGIATGTPERHVYLEGPGASGTDQIHVNIRAYRDPSNITYFNWDLRGAVAFDGAETFDAQPSGSPIVTNTTLYGGPRLVLSDANMTYWFIANGRRFIVIADVGGVWSSMYGGFYLPYATPSEMPYPFFLGGNSGEEPVAATEISDKISSFYDPVGTAAFMPGSNSCILRGFDGSWVPVSNYNFATGVSRSNILTGTGIWPYNFMYNEDVAGDIIIQNADGSSSTLPCVINSPLNGGNCYGELDGVVWTSGISRFPADTLLIDGETYLIIRSSFRLNTSFNYAAINLT